MRALVIGGVVMMGCSGGGNDPVDARPRDSMMADAAFDAGIDANFVIDAAPGCGLDGSYGYRAFGMPANPVIRDNFVDATGPYAGRQQFVVGNRVHTNMNGSVDLVAIQVIEPTTGFAANTAYPNQADPLASTWEAYAYMLDDYDLTADTFASMYWATSGATTFKTVDQTTGSRTDGYISTMTFQQIDQNGAIVTGGCTATILGYAFYLQQN